MGFVVVVVDTLHMSHHCVVRAEYFLEAANHFATVRFQVEKIAWTMTLQYTLHIDRNFKTAETSAFSVTT